MLKKLCVLLGAAVLLFLAGCSKDAVSDEDLMGRWEWVMSETNDGYRQVHTLVFMRGGLGQHYNRVTYKDYEQNLGPAPVTWQRKGNQVNVKGWGFDGTWLTLSNHTLSSSNGVVCFKHISW